MGDGPSLHIWDFGGQEILHETHKFFLTERSIYLLVLEDRREDDTSLFKWLKIITNRGGTSPVILVINKSDDAQAKLSHCVTSTEVEGGGPIIAAGARAGDRCARARR